MSAVYRTLRGQTSLEYLLLLAVVAVVVIASFGPGALVSQVHDSAQGYYNTVTRVIMGSGSDATPAKINGGWCPMTCPTSGYGFNTMYGLCECPAPAFGGAFCTAGNVSCVGSNLVDQFGNATNKPCEGQKITCNGVNSCGNCPQGQACGVVAATQQNPSGCGCANGLTCNPADPTQCSINGICPPKGSVPINCQYCGCPQGSFYYAAQSACVSCATVFPCTTYNNQFSCVTTTCGTNQSCDLNPNDPPEDYGQCVCNQGGYSNGTACVYCTATTDSSGNPVCTTSTDGRTCSAVTCPTNMYCNGAQNACQCSGHWDGINGCVPGPCTPGKCPAGAVCGPDQCGTANGCNGSNACPPAGQPSLTTCNTTVGQSTTGQCVCTPNCNGKDCGSDGCGGSCGNCVLSGSTCQSGTCVCTKQCANNQCGDDGCGGSCLPGCSSSQTCIAGQCVSNSAETRTGTGA